MSPTRRIILNFVATYGRSLFSLACGLFSSRWILMCLGEVDYGLWGVVGGLTGFVSFFNDLLSTSVGRYYAFAVGAAQTDKENGLRECREWFNTALLIHSAIPVILLIVGYPLVEWGMRAYLTIPPERMTACVWVLRYSCLACFVSMISVPFNAMYLAKQYIAELTIYTVAATSVRMVVLYYMLEHPRDYLAVWAAIVAGLSIVPQLIISVRAVMIFPECRFDCKYLWQPQKIKELFVFAGYRFASALSIMAQSQGLAIVVNKMLGASRNAAMTLGNTLASQGETLSNSLFGALSPAITNAAGAGDLRLMRSLSYRACKFGAILFLIFAIPMALEVTKLFELWLKTPPEFADKLSVCCMLVFVLEKVSAGHYMAIFAVGKIAGYQLSVGICGLLAIPLAVGLAYCGNDLLSIGYALIAVKVIVMFIRLYYARKWAGLSAMLWLNKIFLPLTLTSVVGYASGWVVTHFCSPSLLRIIITTLAVEMVIIPLIWCYIFDIEEKIFVTSKLKALWSRIRTTLKN